MSILRVFIQHAKWNLKQHNIKFADSRFAINKALNDYTLANNPDVAYLYISDIFINYLSLMTKWIKV